MNPLWPARVWLSLALALLLVTSVALGQGSGAPSAAPSAAPSETADAGAASGDAGADAAVPAPPEDVTSLRLTAERLRAFLAGALDVRVAPQSLFDVNLQSERAVLVEAERLGRLLEAVDRSSVDAGPDAQLKPPPQPATKVPARKQKAASPPDAGPADAGVDAAFEPEPADQELLAARLTVDRLQLRFLKLPPGERSALLEQHAAQVEASKSTSADTDSKIARTQETRAEAEEAQRKALEEARVARSEILKLLGQEKARLLGVRVKQADFETQLLERERKLDEVTELRLEWQRRTDEHVSQRTKLQATATESDQFYQELRGALRKSRGELRAALDKLSADTDDVPAAGEDKVDSTGLVVDRTEYDTLRSEVLAKELVLREQAAKLGWREAGTTFDAVESLNKNRLAVFGLMSPDQRARLTGFNAIGVDQASSELTQVALVTRYHVRAAIHWTKNPTTLGISSLVATFVMLKLTLALGVFYWWRRRADTFLRALAERAEAAPTDSGLHRYLAPAVSVLRRVRSPLEWLVLAWATIGIIGPPANQCSRCACSGLC